MGAHARCPQMGSPARCSEGTVWPQLLLRGPPLPFPRGEPCSPHQHPESQPPAAGWGAAPREPEGRTTRGRITPRRLQEICILCSPMSLPSPVHTCVLCPHLCALCSPVSLPSPVRCVCLRPCPHLCTPVCPVITCLPALTCAHLCALCSPVSLPSPVHTCVSCAHLCPCPHLCTLVCPVLTCVPALTCAHLCTPVCCALTCMPCAHLRPCPHLCTSWRFSCRSRLCCSPLAAVSFSSSDTRFSRKTTWGVRWWLENKELGECVPQADGPGDHTQQAGEP